MDKEYTGLLNRITSDMENAEVLENQLEEIIIKKHNLQIRNGYIDETYSDYMTYFYEKSLSRIDKTFLRSIADKKLFKWYPIKFV